jgi:hypothetical protein
VGLIFKVLLTGLVILVVWWVIRFRGRISVLKAAMQAAQKVARGEAAKASKPSVPVVLVACPKCGTYIAAGTACACGNT